MFSSFFLCFNCPRNALKLSSFLQASVSSVPLPVSVLTSLCVSPSFYTTSA